MTTTRIVDDPPVRTLVIDRPGRRNAIPADGWAELERRFTEFAHSDLGVLVIRGEGVDFCSGADLGDAGEDGTAGYSSPVANSRWMAVTGTAAVALHRLRKPTVAAVDGVAVGAGMNLALGCDIVVATSRARFSEIFVRRGLTVDFGGTWLLPQLVGMARARDLALTGRIVDAEEALGMGLVSRVVEPGDLDATIDEIATSLATAAPLAVAMVKTALSRSTTMTFEQAIAHETQSQAVLLASADFAEAVAAFGEKRPPLFEGR